ncbi:L,D-transpeptidase family protein [Streptomyces sp. NBC_01216]|uniref:L,D-transpeptidase family protein n=1 Tax=unclassified Streptomyces TaxID=2593676 RepID=UPI002E0FAD23|nr:L,D-transpeptidase family protein [Streptomyces sp. NBC_01216]
MQRSSVIRRALVAVAALAAVTGCTAQAAGPQGAAGSSAPSTPVSAAPVSSSEAPSPSASSTTPAADDKPSAAPTTAAPASTAPAARVLMKDGDESERVRELQARLRQVGYFDRAPTGFYGSITGGAVKGFQKKRELPQTGSVDETTWRRLLAMTHRPTADELKPATTNKLDKPDARCLTGRVLCISKESRTLAWMIDGKVVSSMDVRFGSENTPTREGVFKVDFKSRDHVSTLYHTSMPFAMFFSGGQAVHYSADFAARGYNGASHGCVNVRDRGRIASLFDQVKVGDKVVVHW